MIKKAAIVGAKVVAATAGLGLYAAAMFVIGAEIAGAQPVLHPAAQNTSVQDAAVRGPAEGVYVFDDRAPTPSEILAVLAGPIGVGGLSSFETDDFMREAIDETMDGRTVVVGSAVEQSAAEVAGRPLVVKPSADWDTVDGVGDAHVRQGLAAPIEFELDSARIRPEYEEHIANFATAMQTARDMKILVVGHADASGPAAYNQDLSERRAESVRAALYLHYGVARDRIRFEGRGETDPLHLDAYDPRNRRVEFYRVY